MSPALGRQTLILCIVALAWPKAQADDAVVSLPPLVVSATRLPTPLDELGSSVTVITADDIARKQARTLPDVLQDVPGLNIVQTGGPGGQTNVFMRGTNANHTKVVIDGIDVSDPSSADGAFDFSQILASDIDRIEILRGPQSGLYGSDAIGGVIDIVTRHGSGPAQARVSLEGGSFGTFNQTAGLHGSVARLSYDFDVAHYRSTDTPATPIALVPSGRPVHDDFYDNTSVSTRLGVAVTDNFDLGLVMRYTLTELRSTFDDALGPEAILSDSDNREVFTRASAHWTLFDGTFEQTAGIGYTDYRRRVLDPNATPAVPTFYRGNRIKFDWQGNLKLMPGETLTLGAEHQIDAVDDSSPVQAHIINDAGFAQLQSSLAERVFNAISVRYDSNEQFGSKATFREAPSVLIPETGTRLKASVGTAFKAPTLDELYDSYPAFGFFANPDLKPETSLGYDAGFEQTVLGERVQFGATYFHNDISNLITINAAGTTYDNVGRATTYGVESFVAYQPTPALALRADYTYTHAEDDILHQQLIRRPKDKASVNATWRVTDAAAVSATVLYVGPWADTSRDGTASGVTVNGYTVVNVAGSYDLGHGLTAFARIDNLLDRHYQDPLGFLRPGIGVFGGLRVAFDQPT